MPASSIRRIAHPSIPGGAPVSRCGVVRVWSVSLAGVIIACAGLGPAQAERVKSTPLTFRVDRFELEGGMAVDAAVVDAAIAPVRGRDVSLPEIRRALVRLQQALKEQGHTGVSLVLPQQTLTDGTVRVRVQGVSPVVGTGSAPVAVPSTYAIRHFEVRGNATLTAEEIDAVLGPGAGEAVDIASLRLLAAKLQSLYRGRGLDQAVVTIPGQVLSEGLCVVIVREGETADARRSRAEAERSRALAAAQPKPQPTFAVTRYEVLGNTLLNESVIQNAFTNAVGPAVNLSQVQQGLGELQLAYRERGYETVSVGLPPQQLTNGVVKVQVTQGMLAEIAVAGNRHFSSNNVMRSLPSLRTNTFLNGRIFQRELDIANQNRDRQIYPVIGPGPEPGTSALTLRVKDRLPLHGRVEINNHSTPGTPEWRVNTSAQYNNLWQQEHQVGASYGFSPEAYKADGLVSDLLFNRPLIANLGGYYRLPFGESQSVEEQVRSSQNFGYDEATRQFRLPPAGARPDFSFFGSTASSDTDVQRGELKLVSQTPLLTIQSQDTGRNITLNDSAGVRLNVPLALSETRRLSFSAGPDWKRSSMESFNTNNFFITTVITNAQGSQIIQSQVSSPQPARKADVQYLPFAISADYSQTDAQGVLSASMALSGNLVGSDEDFSRFAYTTNVSANHGKVLVTLTRDQRLPRGWSLVARGTAQFATGALISNEQYSIGGVNSVRGYADGEVFGDTGWFTSAELRTPFAQASVPFDANTTPVWVRGIAFVDYARGYHLELGPGIQHNITLWGAGIGASANVNNQFDLRLILGWPLLDSPIRRQGDVRAYLTVGGQF